MPHHTRYDAQRQASQARTTITAIWLHVNISNCSAVHSSSKIRSATATIRRLHGFCCSAGPLLIRYRLHSRQTLHIRGGCTLQCCPRPAAAAQPSMHLFGAPVRPATARSPPQPGRGYGLSSTPLSKSGKLHLLAREPRAHSTIQLGEGSRRPPLPP